MPAKPAQDAGPSGVQPPLCVDLDGTLIRSDVLWESMMKLANQSPLTVFLLPLWWMQGRAYLKQRIAERVELDVAVLPYNQVFLEYLVAEKRAGRKLILATAADERLAFPVARHTGLFEEVVASNGKTNLRGHNKVRHLTEKFGVKGFDYAGNSTVDLPVWEGSREAVVVNADEGLVNRARKLTRVGAVFNDPLPLWSLCLKALRPHQWVKNLIILVPLVTSHQLSNPRLLSLALLALVAFSFCASAVYVLNDLLDMESDRHHATKKHRPFASGRLLAPVGFALMGFCLLVSAVLCCFLPGSFAAILAAYLVLTTTYSWRLKQTALLDVFCLAGLYTIRLVAGHAATGIPFSTWLIAFSMFIFLSLALVKRYAELRALQQQQRNEVVGRGYLATDLDLVASLGIGNGYIAVLVMALYVNSQEVRALYEQPSLLLLACPLLLFWISRVWLLAHRGKMHEDPIVFALKDPVSYAIGALTLGVVWLATALFH